jgi:glycylpeptide N-tetradecanoyltransferase
MIPRSGVVNSYVSSDASGKIINLCSFYHLPSSVINNSKHDHIYAAYSYYNVADASTSLTDLMDDALFLAKIEDIDVFNCLDVMENHEFLQPLKFGAGDGNLRYYLYNMAAKEVSQDQIGLVLL